LVDENDTDDWASTEFDEADLGDPRGAKLTSVTVSKDAAGRYHIAMLCDDVVRVANPSY
jgi:hypothetical protein